MLFFKVSSNIISEDHRDKNAHHINNSRFKYIFNYSRNKIR